MKKRAVDLKRAGIVNLILVVIGIVWTIYSMVTVVPPDGSLAASRVIHVLMLITLLAETLYCVNGYLEKFPVMYEVTLCLYAAVTFVTAVLVRNGPVILPAFSILSFGILCALAFGGRIDRRRDNLLCGINVLIAAVRIIVYGILTAQFPGGMFGNFLLAVILGFMICSDGRPQKKHHVR